MECGVTFLQPPGHAWTEKLTDHSQYSWWHLSALHCAVDDFLKGLQARPERPHQTAGETASDQGGPVQNGGSEFSDPIFRLFPNQCPNLSVRHLTK